LQSALAYNDYFQSHVATQGSAYLYLHGLDGVPRDLALFSMPLTYLDPARAKELIGFILMLQRAQATTQFDMPPESEIGSISYAYHGYGILDGRYIHVKPSDIDIYL